MKQIPLTQGQVAIVDDEDYELVSSVKWYAQRVKRGNGFCFYAANGGGGRLLQMHRYILNVKDSNILVDHRDGNGLNNCRNNIRTCTQAENVRNMRKTKISSSKYKGVTKKPDGRYEASVEMHKKCYYAGRFIKEEEAALAYNKKATELFGEFANLNIIDFQEETSQHQR